VGRIGGIGMTPDKEDLKQLSRLYNQIRILKFLRGRRKKKLWAPIDAAIKEAREQLFHEYDKHIDRLIDESLELRRKMRLDITYAHGYDLKRFKDL
jgi:hypothetical protein